MSDHNELKTFEQVTNQVMKDNSMSADDLNHNARVLAHCYANMDPKEQKEAINYLHKKDETVPPGCPQISIVNELATPGDKVLRIRAKNLPTGDGMVWPANQPDKQAQKFILQTGPKNIWDPIDFNNQ